MLVTTDPELQDYIKRILTQVEKWIVFKNITHLVLAISSKETREVLERWQFDISLEDDQVDSSDSTPIQHTTEEQIQKDIQALIRQITASVTFLPSLEEKCTFNILIYTDMGAEVPSDWINTDPHPVKNFEQVKFRSFSTTVHKVDSFVSYRRDSDVC
ncbi:Mitotic spindle checkpoint component mad2 [Zancudomyces culisetae]|uniref:Mitotic spindle checkpoint component mad2 n=1 Tax=Zancudomyces culisetae TaxID=1213189 RepID=A0A1R1PCI9_ZANCU|nr:Mitotic spindle checkpoint component mad2 [Zancudomyces culisetae]|eukprot:OMH78687.1 Mitotic spindle checkpoint component mad2 [Zancudomyces culisetae]